MVWELDDRNRAGSIREDEPEGPAPGKVTLTESLPRRRVQRAAQGGGPAPEPARLQAIADRGVDDATSPLPYADVIARSFGRHDVGGVRTATGGGAAEAAQALGARAYATGDTIAFGSAPDLRLAAHEAAHVVQQRAGVQLDGGVGRADDPYEQHADAVADLVVRGQSAEALLDRHAGGGGGGVQRSVQRFAGGGGAVASEAPASDEGSAALAESCSEAASDAGTGGAPAPDGAAAGPDGAPAVDPAAAAAATARGPTPTEATEIAAAAAAAGGPEAPSAAARAPEAAGTGAPTATGTAAPTASTGGASTAAPTSAPAPTSAAPVAAGDGAAWESFAGAFGGFPPDVRALFGGSPTGAQLAQTFTPTQRDKLTAFLGNGQIPDRLFNGGDVARPPAQAQAATARQRILVSGHIMTTGTYANRQLEQQRVEARMCGHFVSLINAYAGVGSASAHDVRGSFDYRGDVVLFTGTAGHTTHSRGNLPVDQFDTIQPGDWLYINAGGNHSVVFGAWEQPHAVPRRSRDGTRTILARNAITYDQRHNNRGEGGLRHDHTPLGAEPSRRDPYVWAITRVQPPEETNVATSVDDLLPGADTLTSAAERNRAGLEQSGITADAARAHVQTQNAALIEHVGRPRAGGDRSSRLSDSQRTLLTQANAVDNLEQLVHLNERLQRLAASVDALETGEGRGPFTYGEFDDTNTATRAASGHYDTSAGHVGDEAFDNTDESRTTGLLENVRAPLAGYTPARGGAAGRHGGRAT